MLRPGLPPHVLWLLRDRASEVERQCPSAGFGPAREAAFMHAPDDPYLQYLLQARDRDPDPEAREAGQRLRRDHGRLLAGWTPSEAELADAPTLVVKQGFIGRSLEEPPLVQAVLLGRPLGPYGQPAPRLRVTSLLIAIERHEGLWARTYNRFYRLMQHEGVPPDLDDLWPEDGR